MDRPLRDRIAFIVASAIENKATGKAKPHLAAADAILAIPEIAEARVALQWMNERPLWLTSAKHGEKPTA